MNVLFSKIIKNKLALLGGIILFILLLLIITTPFLNLSDPNAINTSDRFSLPFTSNYLLGADHLGRDILCLLYTSPSPRDATLSRMPSSA